MKKRGISPVIATILLIMIVIILAVIIFLWARGFVKETITKKGMPSYQACDEVDLKLSYIGTELQITNVGNIPVYRLEIKKKSGGSVEVDEIEGLSTGESEIIDIGSGYEVEVVPAILGETETSKKIDVCQDNVFYA